MFVRTPRTSLRAAALLCVLFAAPASAQVVISQAYGGGGNSGATYTHDFVELFNRGPAAVDMTGWSLQYASATGTSWSNKVDLPAVSLQPGQYYLIQLAKGTGGTTALPTPDLTGSIGMAGTNLKLALVANTTVQTGTCPTGAQIIDFVGTGTATCYEGTAAVSVLREGLKKSRQVC
jgi:predicted extracellular nuclease